MMGAELKNESLIRLTRKGTFFSGNFDKLAHLQSQFETENFVKLTKLIEPEVLQTVLQRIDKSEFYPRVHENIGKEICLTDNHTLHLLRFLVINLDFFRLIQRITNCGKIGFFDGRVYRFVPDDGHFGEWHNDLIDDRLVALSVNLSPKPYLGGNLQLRDDRSGEIQEITNTGFGDGILFRLGSYMHHRVGKVEGNFDKTAFAGWFKSNPDFFARLKSHQNGS